ncbi:tetratricopeptide repeat protein [Candidatus Omnitrophota bacterium]
MRQEHKVYILENIGKKSIKEIARELNLKERKIKRFLEEQKKKQKETRPARETRPPSFNKKTFFISIILIIILGVSIYANSLDGKFLWDDDILVRDNLYIRDWSNIGKLASGSISTLVSTGGFKFYRPLQMITYLVDYSLWKLDVKGYHITNILIHILVALSIYWLINILYGDRLISLVTSLLFIVHPVHAGPVSYISGRSDSLGALFMLLSFIFYIKLVNKEKVGFYIIMLLSYIASLLSREASLILIVLALLYHYSFRKKMRLRNLLSLLVIAIIYILLRLTLLKDLVSHAPISTTFLQRLPGFFVAITNYIKLLVFPFHLLHMEYGIGLFNITNPGAIIGILILFSSLIYAFRKKDNNLISFSICWFFVALLPVSNIFYPLNAYMADNWLYIPSLGAFIIIAKGLTYLYRDKRFQILTLFFTLGLLSTFSYLTIKENKYFGEPIAFYKRVLEYAPRSSRVYYNLGNTYRDVGNTKEAISSYKKAIEVNPNHVETYNNLGNIYKDTGKTKEAIPLYKKALELDPDYLAAYNNLGVAYVDIGKTKEAMLLYKKALELNPDHAEVYGNLGLAYADIGNIKEAIVSYKKAIKLDPDYAEAYSNLGLAYADIGNTEEAISLCKKALELDPNYVAAYNNLGVAYKDIGNTKEAISLYKKAIKLDPDHAGAYNNLGNTYADIGNTKEAISLYKKALELDPDYAEAYSNLGIAYKDIGNTKEAISSYKKALELKPDYLEAYNNLGNAYLDIGNTKEAISSYKKALELNQNLAELHNNLGAAYKEIGNTKEAISSYKKALELNPNLAGPYNGLSKIYFQEQQYDMAIRYCDRAIELGLKISPKHLENLTPYRK